MVPPKKMFLNIFRRSTLREAVRSSYDERPRRVVLITGGSSGIGRATAELIAVRGYRVFGGVRAPGTTRPLVGVELVRLDVRDEASAKACVDEVRNRAGRIDI